MIGSTEAEPAQNRGGTGVRLARGATHWNPMLQTHNSLGFRVIAEVDNFSFLQLLPLYKLNILHLQNFEGYIL
jgi:hypothetical protein